MTSIGRKNVNEIVPPPQFWWEQSSSRFDHSSFQESLSAQSVLDLIETGIFSPISQCNKSQFKVLFWNVERCKFVAKVAEKLELLVPDVILLAELDNGMARSGNLHTTRELAQRLQMNYVFAVEFLELGLGDARERTWHQNEKNARGMHGGAILSRCPLKDPAVFRLELEGKWFDGQLGERRVGGRIAIAAQLETPQGPLSLVSVHFESHSTPLQRLTQMQILCDHLQVYSPHIPWIIGGDFNTHTFEQESAMPILDFQKQALMRDDPTRLENPVSYEPMFQTALQYGLQWINCNASGSTQRTRPDGTPAPPFGKIDWFFTKTLAGNTPEIVPAVDSTGRAISDHEILSYNMQMTSQEHGGV